MDIADLAGGFEDSNSAGCVDLVSGDRMSDRSWNRRSGRKVDDGCRTRHRGFKDRFVQDGTFDESEVQPVEVVGKPE